MSLPYDKGDESGSVPSTSDGYPYGAVVYTTDGSATVVTLTVGLPVQPQTGSTWVVSADSLPLPSGAATAANQDSEIAALTSIDARLSGTLVVGDGGNSLTVDGPLTDAQLRASDVSVTVVALPLPSGAATAANQDTTNVSLASIDGKLPALGQALAAGSVPVVLTAAQLATLTPLTTVAVTGTFWQATQPVSAVSLPLPSGAATDANQGTANTSLASIDAKLVSLATGHGTAAAAVRVELPTDGTGVVGLTAGSAIVGKVGIDQTTPGTTDSVTVKSTAYSSQPTVTRPANTTPYSAGDVVGGAITFSSAGPSGGHLLVTTADLRIDVAAVPSGMTSFRLYLYDVTPPSALADNAPWDLPSGDRSAYLGYLDLGTVADLGSTLYTQATNPGLQVKLASASTTLYAYLVTTGGFSPAANSEVYTPRIKGVAV